jgi:hypothetical protein
MVPRFSRGGTSSTKINVPSEQHSAPAANDYWSIENQARRLDEKKEREHAERDARRLTEDQQDRESKRRQSESMQEEAIRAQQESVARQPVLTYEMALALALRDAGYHQFDNLNALQKARVLAEMSKYNYLPRSRRLDGGQADEEGSQAVIDQTQSENEQRARDVEQAYRTEKRWQEVGAQGREDRYLDAVKNCKNTQGAKCR